MFRPKTIFTRKETVLLTRYFSTLEHRIPRAGLVQNTVGYERFTKFDAVEAWRRQHSLATMDDQQLRETRQLLLLSLKEIACVFPKYATAVKLSAAASSGVETSDDEDGSQSQQESLETTPIQAAGDWKRGIQQRSRNFDENKKIQRRERSTDTDLLDAIRAKDVRLTKRLFLEAVKDQQTLSRFVLMRMFYLVVQKDPALALLVAKQHRQGNALSRSELSMYLQLCGSVGSIDSNNVSRWYKQKFIDDLLDELDPMQREAKQELIPKLITGLAKQRSVLIGSYASDLYQYMVENNYEMSPGWLKKLLGHSKYNRQDDLPFHDIMERLTTSEIPPHPLSAIQAIHNMYPFTESEKIRVALRSIYVLQEKNVLTSFQQYTRNEEIQIDLDCLESISAGAAQSGSYELILLVWEVLEQCNYGPTEAIYENTVIAFASGGRHLETAFGAINSMKNDGYEVSRALLRCFSRTIRSDKQVLDHGMRILAKNNELVSLETLNAMMSCYAERGNVEEVLGILDMIRSKNLKPDTDTYSFAIEVLGKRIHRLRSDRYTMYLQDNLDHANNILDMMDKDGILPSRHFLRNYIELLCMADAVDVANLVVDDVWTSAPESICSKTLYRLVMANLEIGSFQRARDLASRISDNIVNIWKKIRGHEERFRHEEELKRAREQ